MKGYGSFCPIAKAAEILAERWTLLVLRDILVGSRRFNDLRRGVPQMSPTLLSKRMKHWWLVLEAQEIDLCLQDPGHEVDITLKTDLLSLTQVYMGDLSFERARSMDRITILGPRALVQSMPNWFARSRFAEDNPLSVT